MAGVEAGTAITLYCCLNHCFSVSSALWNPCIIPVCSHIVSKLIGMLHCALILISGCGGRTRWCRCGWSMEHILSSKNCHVECVCMCMCSRMPLYMYIILPWFVLLSLKMDCVDESGGQRSISHLLFSHSLHWFLRQGLSLLPVILIQLG